MSTKKKNQRQISVRGVVYDQLKREAKERGLSISGLVAAAVANVNSPGGSSSTPPPVFDPLFNTPQVESSPAAREFTCAVCGNGAHGVPAREPFGRGGALVDVCQGCDMEHPREGRNSFGGSMSRGPGEGNSRTGPRGG